MVYIIMTDDESLFDYYTFGIEGVYVNEDVAFSKANKLNSNFSGNHIFFVVSKELSE